MNNEEDEKNDYELFAVLIHRGSATFGRNI